jgi:LysM repeat protein
MAARVSGVMIWLIVLAVVVAACGGTDEGGADGTEQASAPPGEAQSAAASEAPSEPSQDGGSGEGQTYVVKSGDTLSAIAKEFDTTVRAIVRANDIADPDVIDVGQELIIPQQ